MPSSTRALCHRTIPSYGLSVPETVRHEATISPAESHKQQMHNVADDNVEVNPLDCAQASVDFDAEANNTIMNGPIRPEEQEPAEGKLKMVVSVNNIAGNT